MCQKVREEKHQHLGHHGLIKMIVVYALNKIRIPVLWSKFGDMDRETFMDTQTITLGETQTSSVGWREGKEEEEANAEEEEVKNDKDDEEEEEQ